MRFLKYKPEVDLPQPICTHKNLPEKQQHTKLVVNALDYCHTHREKICLVCSEVHAQQHCVLSCTFTIKIVKTNQELGDGNLRQFNLGHMMELPLSNLKCTCGKLLGNDPNHAICAACGLVRMG